MNAQIWDVFQAQKPSIMAVFVYYECMDGEKINNETEVESPNQRLVVVYVGEVAVWMTVVEFYAHHNR